MATRSNLTEILSRQLKLPEREVALFARRLREAGLMPQSSGRHYAPLDANSSANLVVALLTAENAAHAPGRVSEYVPLVGRLEEILADSRWAAQIKHVRVRRNSGQALIEDHSKRVRPPGWFAAREAPSREDPKLEVTVSITGDVLAAVAEAIAGQSTV